MRSGLTRRGFLGPALATLGCSAALWRPALATRIDDFAMQPEAGWRFFTDGVMGGVSRGQVVFLQDAGAPFARMTGRVSTENRGGFIQMRLDLSASPPSGSTGVRLVARGNDQRYFVHLRTTGTVLPWQYYQAGFEVTSRWSEVKLPFVDFRASGRLLRETLRSGSLTSLAVVAYGRDHDAQVDIREIGFF
ncbi:MAG: NADH ubiquinone oxidoreductase [Rhodobacteraceae bacterium]|nr:MAG: NADH ubiquinone oxidoreductase [Paracoccaceae bacterium]